MDKKYICKNCVGCQAQENKNWLPKIKCENFRSDGKGVNVPTKIKYEQQKLKLTI